MDIFFCFLVVGVALVVLILNFDKKQTVKIQTVLKETRGIPPLLMLRSTEQKINTLKTALRFEDAPQNMANAASMANIYGKNDARQSKVRELKLLSARYNAGLISLELYNTKLDEMLYQVHSQGNAFEMAS